MTDWDVAVVGGGIVGLATALALSAAEPARRLGVVEKEGRLAVHQTGHNSGVMHSGAYYRPGTLKARLCAAGCARLEAFCDRHGVPYRRLGKVIVAVTAEEVPALEELHRRAQANGVPEAALLDEAGLETVEPEIAGVAALHLPRVAIVDFSAVAAAMAAELRSRGVEIRTGWRVQGARIGERRVVLDSPRGTAAAAVVVNCAGLHADVVARRMGARPEVRLVPFRGEYHSLRPAHARRVRGLVYPVPDPRFPFLGVHLTPTLDGGVEAGPNALLALSREGYRWRSIRVRDVTATWGYRGFRRLARRHWRMGLTEMHRSLSRRAFASGVARLLPGVTRHDLVRAASGVRAQAVRPDGTLEDDFVVATGPRAVHVVNAPSPAATASLVIGEHVASLVEDAVT